MKSISSIAILLPSTSSNSFWFLSCGRLKQTWDSWTHCTFTPLDSQSRFLQQRNSRLESKSYFGLFNSSFIFPESSLLFFLLFGERRFCVRTSLSCCVPNIPSCFLPSHEESLFPHLRHFLFFDIFDDSHASRSGSPSLPSKADLPPQGGVCGGREELGWGFLGLE